MSKHTFMTAFCLLRGVFRGIKEEFGHRDLYRFTSCTWWFSNACPAPQRPRVHQVNFSPKFLSSAKRINDFPTISCVRDSISKTNIGWTGSVGRMHDSAQVRESIDDGDLDFSSCDPKSAANESSAAHGGDAGNASGDLLAQSNVKADSRELSLADIIDESKRDTEMLATSVAHAPQTSITSVLQKIENQSKENGVANSKETRLAKDVKVVLPSLLEHPKAHKSEPTKPAEETTEVVDDVPPKPSPQPKVYSQPNFCSTSNKILPLKKIQELANDLNNKTAMNFKRPSLKSNGPTPSLAVPENKTNVVVKKPFIYSLNVLPPKTKPVINIEENPVILERKKRMELLRNTVKNINKNAMDSPQVFANLRDNKKITLLLCSKKNIERNCQNITLTSSKSATLYNSHTNLSTSQSNPESAPTSDPPKEETTNQELPTPDTKYEVKSSPFNRFMEKVEVNYILNKQNMEPKNVQYNGTKRNNKFVSHFSKMRDRATMDGRFGPSPEHGNKQFMCTFCRSMLANNGWTGRRRLRKWYPIWMNRKLKTWRLVSRGINGKSTVSDSNVGKTDGGGMPPNMVDEKVDIVSCPQEIIDAHEEYNRLMKKEMEISLPEDIGEIPPGVYQRSSNGCGAEFRSIYAATAPFCSVKSDEETVESAKKDDTTLESMEQIPTAGGGGDNDPPEN